MLEDVANLEVVGKKGGYEAEGGYQQDERHEIAGVASALGEGGKAPHPTDDGRQHRVDGEGKGQQDGYEAKFSHFFLPLEEGLLLLRISGLSSLGAGEPVRAAISASTRSRYSAISSPSYMGCSVES